MNEVWARVGLVVAVIGVALFIAWIMWRRAGGSVITVDASGFEPGVYLFSSTTCSTCRLAREKLETRIGAHGFIEILWERDPEPFNELGVESVPSVMIVDEHRRGSIYPGPPDGVLSALAHR